MALTPEKIASYGPGARKQLRKNVEAVLVRDPADPEALRILSMLAKSTPTNPPRSSRVGRIAWSLDSSGTYNGHIDGKPVALIRKLVNHTYTNEEVYQVELPPLVEKFRYIGEARRAAEHALASQEKRFDQPA